jgi:hypothetical protein
LGERIATKLTSTALRYRIQTFRDFLKLRSKRRYCHARARVKLALSASSDPRTNGAIKFWERVSRFAYGDVEGIFTTFGLTLFGTKGIQMPFHQAKELKIAAAVMTLALGGCAKTAEVNFINGRAFLAGDDKCTHRGPFVDPNIMECTNANGRPTGERRRALTQSELQYIITQRQIAAQQLQSLNQSIQQAGNSIQPIHYHYAAPQVMPITRPGGNQVRCVSVGIYMSCRYY